MSHWIEARMDSFASIAVAAKPGCGRDHEAADRPGGPALFGLGPDDGDIGDRSEPDPALRAGDHPVVAVADGRRHHASRVAARGRFGKPEAADQITGSSDPESTSAVPWIHSRSWENRVWSVARSAATIAARRARSRSRTAASASTVSALIGLLQAGGRRPGSVSVTRTSA